MGALSHVLDALTLDGELEALLRTRWQRILGPKLADSLQPEAAALIRAALLWLSFSSSRGAASAGEALLGMQRRTSVSATRLSPMNRLDTSTTTAIATSGAPSTTRLLLLGCTSILLPWAWARLSKLLAAWDATRGDAAEHASRPLWLRLVRRVEGCTLLISLLVTLRYVHRGGGAASPTLPMLCAGVGLAQALPAVPRPPSFDFMEQQLVWRCVADLMLAGRGLWRAAPQTVEVAGTSAAARRPPQRRGELVMRLAQRLRLVAYDADESDASSMGAADRSETTATLTTTACVFCGASPPHTAQVAPCGHAACYYCIASTRLASSRARCPQCNARLGSGREAQPSIS